MATAVLLGAGLSTVILLQRGAEEGNGVDGGRRGEAPEDRPNLPSTDHPGAIEGVVTGPDGRPAPGAQVTAHTFDSISRRGETVAAGSDGSFRLDGLPKGLYGVRARLDGIGAAVVTGVPVPENGTVTLPDPVVLRPGALVTIRILGADGNPLAGVALVLRQEVHHTGRVTYPVVVGRDSSGEDGSASFAGLVDSDYQLQCRREGYSIQNRTFRVERGATAPIEIRMKRAGGGAGKKGDG